MSAVQYFFPGLGWIDSDQTGDQFDASGIGWIDDPGGAAPAATPFMQSWFDGPAPTLRGVHQVTSSGLSLLVVAASIPAGQTWSDQHFRLARRDVSASAAAITAASQAATPFFLPAVDFPFARARRDLSQTSGGARAVAQVTAPFGGVHLDMPLRRTGVPPWPIPGVPLPILDITAEAQVSEFFVATLAGGYSAADARVSEMFAAALTTGQAHGAEVSELFCSALVYRGPCSSRRADLWRITRTDGQVFAFTSLDRPVTWLATSYTPCASLQDSASESSSELGAVGSVQLTGILDDASITDEDIYAGRFNDALVEVWVVSWDGNDSAAPFRVASGRVGQISFGQISYTAEVLGPTEQLKQTALVDIYAPGCRWTFGVQDRNGIGCPVDPEALALMGVNVTGAVSRTTIFFDASMPIETAIWREGKVRWTYGRNAGLECQYEVVEWSSQTILLWDIAPFPIEAGDSFDLLPGCPKDTPSCQEYNVYESFGGFPDVPGPDALQQNAANLFGGG